MESTCRHLEKLGGHMQIELRVVDVHMPHRRGEDWQFDIHIDAFLVPLAQAVTSELMTKIVKPWSLAGADSNFASAQERPE